MGEEVEKISGEKKHFQNILYKRIYSQVKERLLKHLLKSERNEI